MHNVTKPDSNSRILAPSNLLTFKDTRRVTDHLDEDTYYGSFMLFLKDPQKKGEIYKNWITSSEISESTIYRSKFINLANRLGISVDQSIPIVDLDAFDPTVDEAACIVMNNYLEMAHSAEPFSLYGEIDPYGRIIILEGIHRFIINTIRGFSIHPVYILRRNPEWKAFIDFFREEGKQLYKNENALYHEIRHPDFNNFAVIREDRSEAIIGYLRKHPRYQRGLDIGSMIGFYSHRLALAGYKMTAVEKETKYADALLRLNQTYGVHCDLIQGDLYDLDVRKDMYDFSIMLSIVYHLVRNDINKCSEYINYLKTRISLFFVDTEVKTGLLTESTLRDIFYGFAFEKIFSGTDGRDIFAISKDGAGYV